MKRKIAFVMMLLTLAGAVFLAYRIYAGVLTKREISKRIEVLPEITFNTLEGKSFHRTNLPDGIPVALLYFNTDCPHCNAEIDDLLEHSTLLDSVYFLMISRQKPDLLSQFVHEKKLAGLKNISVVTDTHDLFPKTFGTAMVPALFLYGKDQRLIKIFKGETSTMAICRALVAGKWLQKQNK